MGFGFLFGWIYKLCKFFLFCREWYSYHFPELVKIIPDNHLYAKVIKFIGSRKDLTEDRLDDLEEIVMDSTKVQAIFEAGRVSMGTTSVQYVL